MENEVQILLSKWLKTAYKEINDSCIREAAYHGFKEEDFGPDGNYEVVHNVIKGELEGCGLFTYSVKARLGRGDQRPHNILSVEFKTSGFVMVAHRKTILLKSQIKLGNMRVN